ncbi:uncharacterized protein [Misgurnus anguillicaudatus]|uniref:uncharacterized protein n=1 Tax=Misgurnus anguillicaudatus TaxID=75329 RepID=UPI003CCF42BF
MSVTDKTLNSEKSFRVVVRLCALNRPEHSIPLEESRTSINVTDRNKVAVDTGKNHKPLVMGFDAVLNEESSQRDVYESTTKSLVEYLMQGYNGCVIVYGSTGSGKTHTMQGSSISSKQRGIISRAAEDIFTSPKASHCKIRVSFYHIFNEKIFDLLDPKGSEVVWMRDCEEVVRLDGLTEIEVNSAQDLMQVLCRGSARHTGISKGDFPSKSHTVFSIVVINTMVQSPGGVLTASKLTLVDLASSGKCRSSAAPGVKKMISTTNDNPQEAKMLKRSLTIFGNVIFALSSLGSQHVPYRESKLTRALRDCLGGNCRTCLVVTVSSQLSLMSEALSSLQFASQAMAVPSRPIYTSQLRYTPEQVCSTYPNGKKEGNHMSRQQILPPVGSERKSQTCLLPILLSSCSPSEPKPSSSQCGDGLELRTFLPQLEKPGQTEPGGRYSRGSRPVDERNKADARLPRSLSQYLSGAVLHDAGGREKHGKGKEFSTGSRRSVERLSTTYLEPPAASSTSVECLNCSRERKIREEYDKIIVQAKRDKDALSQKVSELENELKRRGKEERDIEAVWRKKINGDIKAGPTSRMCAETSQTAEVCVQTEAEGLRAELFVCCEREKVLTQTLYSERQRLTRDAQELQAQLRKARDQNNQLVSTLHIQQENLLAKLQSSREELENFQEKTSLTLNQLKTEKAELMSHLEDSKTSYEKVCLENSSLRQKLKSFLLEINSTPFSGSSTADTNTSHMHTVTTNTEMIVVSHHVSQQCPTGPAQGSECCFSHFQHPEVKFIEKSETTNGSDCEQILYKPKSVYKQLRREHSLLLDVMLVLYRREWFLQDAIPYVRRTLRKCGLKPEDID